MLPERLSTDLTSLAFGEERHALVADLVMDAAGTVTDSTVYRALVLNRAKLAYNSVAAWLDGEAPMPEALAAVPGLADELRAQDEAAGRLRQSRLERGALDFQTIEARPVFDGNAVKALVRGARQPRAQPDRGLHDCGQQRDRAVPRSEGLPVDSPRRAIAGAVGPARDARGRLRRDRCLPNPIRAHWQTSSRLRRAADPLRFPDLSLAVIKLLGAGEYVVERPHQEGDGHFGLAVKDYTHSTAPNRRFPDLVTQRLLKAAIAGSSVPYSADELDRIAAHCTDMEDEAHKVERLARKAAAALLLESQIGRVVRRHRHRAPSAKGTWVRVFKPPVEGKLMRGVEGLDVGDRVRVRLVHTDARRGFIDFVKA